MKKDGKQRRHNQFHGADENKIDQQFADINYRSIDRGKHESLQAACVNFVNERPVHPQQTGKYEGHPENAGRCVLNKFAARWKREIKNNRHHQTKHQHGENHFLGAQFRKKILPEEHANFGNHRLSFSTRS